MSKSHYGRLLAMAALSFLSMYALMYAMVNTFANVYPNFNQFYMAALITTSMVIIELGVMRTMYRNRTMNALIAAASVIALAVFWTMIRQQTAISDRQFLKSMIPHHAGAILMCEEAPIGDRQIKELCDAIIGGQQSEIRQMKERLAQLEVST